VNVDSFFEALGHEEAVIEFVGGCHEPSCCANGACTNFSGEAWIWNEDLIHVPTIRLRWDDVYKATGSMLAVIDEYTERNEKVWNAKIERIPFYRSQLTLLEARIDNLR
jgi:hypothetical protein